MKTQEELIAEVVAAERRLAAAHDDLRAANERYDAADKERHRALMAFRKHMDGLVEAALGEV